MARKHIFLHYTRYTHLYLGVFIAPALLFFAFTGAMQTFSLHETTRGSSYKPPAWIATLAQIHKKQTMTIPVRRLPPTAQADSHASGDHKADNFREDKTQPLATIVKSHNPLPLKLFFLLVSIGLFTSTLSGLYMSYRYSRNRKLITALLIAGIVIPITLLYL